MEKLLQSKEYCGLVETGITAAPSDATPEQFKAVEERKIKDLKVGHQDSPMWCAL